MVRIAWDEISHSWARTWGASSESASRSWRAGRIATTDSRREKWLSSDNHELDAVAWDDFLTNWTILSTRFPSLSRIPYKTSQYAPALIQSCRLPLRLDGFLPKRFELHYCLYIKPVEMSDKLQWSQTKHLDGSKDIGVSLGTGTGLNARGFVDSYKDSKPGFAKQNAHNYNSIGGGLSLNCPKGHEIGVGASHMPAFGNEVGASAKLNLMKTDSHKLDANAFASKSFPHNGAPPSVTHGGSLNYQFKDKFNAAAGMSQTSAMGMHQKRYDAGAGVNLFKTPTTSLDCNFGASKTVSPFGSTPWQSGGYCSLRKKF
ncbi:Defense protein 3 [Eumeta japonica]|uniref:Defense protein 3 n=1 Tax=Eumeta variegata TaxID=151549 RepID=A0A4C1W571_EUMVA|nr:Defense protein 3 [Eumeta japonica]